MPHLFCFCLFFFLTRFTWWKIYKDEFMEKKNENGKQFSIVGLKKMEGEKTLNAHLWVTSWTKSTNQKWIGLLLMGFSTYFICFFFGLMLQMLQSLYLCVGGIMFLRFECVLEVEIFMVKFRQVNLIVIFLKIKKKQNRNKVWISTKR